MDFYLINLDRDVARRRWMEAQLDRQRLRVTRVPGVPGDALSAADRAYHGWAGRVHLSAGEIGCLLSHLRVWQAIAEGDSDHAVVFEDDVHLAEDFRLFVERLRLSREALCVHRLETFRARVTLDRHATFRVGHRAAYRLNTNHGGAAAYLLNRRTARHLLQFRERLCHLPDVELFDPERRAVGALLTYQWTPAPCIQDFLVPRTAASQGFGSNLDHDRSDRRAGVLRADSRLNRRLKAIARPMYTAAYSLMLAPRGLQRVDVHFG
ncbi:MAG: glycosyltransferase family 25 protein [Polyangiales bacterium]